ncbi:hypothetical protein WMY93_026130 [Mugilogobius chulae]|uniref:HAT C-terminal dimerisation domain-containing protein n=1 Tax=Mugilogobius chulae TaxID=88201 RepID=A0AAW0MY56_9GOBI
MAHTLQLAVHEAVLSQRSISDCIAFGRKMVGHFKHSQVATRALVDLQTKLGMKPARLQQDVSTRWNSTFYMLRSLLQQKRALAAYGVDHSLPTLNPMQWSLIENMLTILDPCEQLTRDICKATSTTADVIPAVQALKRLLHKTVATDHGVKKTSKTTLLESINTRFNHVDDEPLYFLATILDPRYKDRYFTSATKQQAKKLVLEKMNTQQRQHTHVLTDEPEAETTESGNNSLLDMYAEILEENTDSEVYSEKGHIEMQATLPLSSEEPAETPLEYWRTNKTRFPDLAELARKYLSAPCTSVDSERLFQLLRM